MKFKPNDRAPRFHSRPQRGLGHIQIGDDVRRAVILESDKCFTGNFRQLKEQVRAGKLTRAESVAIEQWLVASSLRRNHVPLAEARRLASV